MTLTRSALTGLGREIEDHWREHRPNMVRELERRGVLYDRLKAAEDRTWEELEDLIQEGVDYYAAWEMVREKYAFLPAEEHVAALGETSVGLD